MSVYRYFSITISAPDQFEVPFVEKSNAIGVDVDVVLAKCPLDQCTLEFTKACPKYIHSEFHPKITYQRSSGQCRIEIDGKGLFEMPNSSTVYAQFYTDNISESAYEFWTHVVPTLMDLRGGLVFHANTIVIDKAAYLFVGQSGAGKSTFSTYLHKHGYPLLSDDITVVMPGENQFYAVQGKREVRLLKESQSYLNLEIEESFRQIEKAGAQKYCYLLDSETSEDRYPIKALFYLKANSDFIQITPLSGVDKFQAAIDSLFSISHPHLMKPSQPQFQKVMHLVNTLEMHVLERTNSFSSLSLMCEEVIRFHKSAVTYV